MTWRSSRVRDGGTERGGPRASGFDAFYDAHVCEVRRYLRTRTRRADLDDACIEVFVAAHRHFEHVGGLSGGDARLWLLAAGNHAALHLRRSAARELRRVVRLSDQAERVPSHQVDAFDAFAYVTAERVRSVLEALSPAEREILQMLQEDQASGIVLGQMLGVSEGAARVRLLRARRAFMVIYVREFGRPFRGKESE